MGATTAYFTYNGVNSVTSIRKGSIDIQDNLNEAPNTCSFIWDGLPRPQAGAYIQISLGQLIGGFYSGGFYSGGFSTANYSPSLLFAGNIVTISELYEGKIDNKAWHVVLEDPSYLLNRRRPIRVFTGNADDVVIALIAQFSHGFTTNNVQRGLPPITITFDGSQDFLSCMTAICNLIGASWFPDYYNDIHVNRAT